MRKEKPLLKKQIVADFPSIILSLLISILEVFRTSLMRKKPFQ